MPNLSTKELGAIEEQLEFEMVLVKKYNSNAKSTNDQALKTFFEQTASKHQQHYDKLRQLLI